MNSEIKIPSMGESISEVTIGSILKQNGTFVKRDEEIVEIETDKVNQALFAPESGKVTLTVKTGDVVKIGAVIGTIEASSETVPEKKEPEKKEPEKKEPEKKVETPHQVRIPKEAIFDEEKKPVSKVQTSTETRAPLSKVRKRIAERLLEAKQESAMLTTFNEIDMSNVLKMRELYQERFMKRYGVKLGFMAFFLEAAIHALKVVPEVNSYIDGDELVTRHTADIGIAVGTERGLIVPVIRDAGKLHFPEIELAISNFAKKAREGGLTVDDIQGAGFTITNGGIFGSLLSTPILNPPGCAILGMHKIEKRAVVVNEEIVIRPMMYVALSYDHRVIDGKEAVTFLAAIKDAVEDPARIVLEV